MSTTEISHPVGRDGVWIITVTRADGAEEVRFPDRKAALAGELALKRAAALLLPRQTAADVGSVHGPYYERDKKRWKLRWTENGESRAFVRASREEVAAKKDALLGATAKRRAHLKALPAGFGGTAPEMKQAIVDGMIAMNRAEREGDDQELHRLRKYVAGISEASHAIVPHTKYAEEHQEFVELIKYLEDIQRGRDAGQPPNHRCINRTLADRPRPPAAIH